MRAILAALALVCVALTAHARPYTIDDMLALESYGQVQFSPDAQILMVERRARYDSAARFDYGGLSQRATSRIMVLRTRQGRRLVEAFPQERGSAYWLGAFSPSGSRMSVFRLRRARLSLGILDVNARTVRWLPGAPDLPLAAPAPVWIDDERLVHVRFKTNRLPFALDVGGRFQRSMSLRWRAQREGRIGSADMATSRFSGVVPGEDRELVVSDTSARFERVLLSGEISEFQLSPDRRRAVVALLGRSVAPHPDDPVTSSYVERARMLRIVPIDGALTTDPCPRCDVSKARPVFSTAGELAFIARTDGQSWVEAQAFVWRKGEALRSESRERPIRAAWAESAFLWQTADGDWYARSFDGLTGPRRLGALRYLAGNGKYVWFADHGNLWRVGREGSLLSLGFADVGAAGLDHGDPASVGFYGIRDPSRLVLRSKDSTEVTFGFEGMLPKSVRIARGAEVLAVSDSRYLVAYLSRDVRGVGRLFLAAGGTPREIDVISAHLANVDVPRAVPITRSVGEVRRIDWLVLPEGPGPYPTIVIPYQGLVYDDDRPDGLRLGNLRPAMALNVLVARGYAVLLPSIPTGPAGQPQDTLLPDADAALDAAIRTGLVDPNRLGVFGHSYGGVNALMMAAGSTRYKAIAAASGAVDLAAIYGYVNAAQRTSFVGGAPLDSAVAWFETGQGRLEVPPWDDPERYIRASSFFRAARMTTPLLLVSGDIDYVPMSDFERLFVSLSRLGRDVTLLRFFGEGHVLSSPANIRLEWKTIGEFFDKHVLGRREVPIMTSGVATSRLRRTVRKPYSRSPASLRSARAHSR